MKTSKDKDKHLMANSGTLNLVVEVRQFSGGDCYVVAAVTAPNFFTGGTQFMVRSTTRLMTGRHYSMNVALAPDHQGVYEATSVVNRDN